MHYGNGIPIIGLTGVDIPYPFTGPGVYFNDFFESGINHFSDTDLTADWKIGGLNATAAITSVGPVNTASSTPITAAESCNGWLRVITTGASGDEAFIQLQSQTGIFSYTTTAGQRRPVVFQCRARINTITTSTQLFGMLAASAVNGAAGDPIDTQAVGFALVVTNGTVGYQYKTSATPVATTTATYADTGTTATVTAATIHTFTILYDGMGTLRFFLDGRLLKQASVPTFTTDSLSPCLGIDTASAATKSVDVDYVYAGSPTTIGGRA